MPAADIWRAVQGDVILRASADGKITADPDESLVSPADQARDWPDADSATDGIQPFEDAFSVLSLSVGIDNFTEDYRDADKDAAFEGPVHWQQLHCLAALGCVAGGPIVGTGGRCSGGRRRADLPARRRSCWHVGLHEGLGLTKEVQAWRSSAGG